LQPLHPSYAHDNNPFLHWSPKRTDV
jgi:hypothetical protein